MIMHIGVQEYKELCILVHTAIRCLEKKKKDQHSCTH